MRALTRLCSSSPRATQRSERPSAVPLSRDPKKASVRARRTLAEMANRGRDFDDAVGGEATQRGGSLSSAAEQAKDFYSAGASFTALGCSAAVVISWGALARLWNLFEREWVAFVLSMLIVYAYAFVLPEPAGYPDAGKMKLTAAELIFGFFNVLIVFATVVGVKDGLELF